MRPDLLPAGGWVEGTGSQSAMRGIVQLSTLNSQLPNPTAHRWEWEPGVKPDTRPYRNLTHFHLNCRDPRQSLAGSSRGACCKFHVISKLVGRLFLPGWHPPCNLNTNRIAGCGSQTVTNALVVASYEEDYRGRSAQRTPRICFDVP